MTAVTTSALRVALRACLALAFAPLAAPVLADSLPDASTNEVVALRNAITDLSATFGSRYPGCKSFLARLDELVQRANSRGMTSRSFGAKR